MFILHVKYYLSVLGHNFYFLHKSSKSIETKREGTRFRMEKKNYNISF